MKYPETVDKEIQSFIDEIESSELYAVVSAKSDIAVLIHDQMETRGVSCSELSRRLGKSRAYVSKMLGGGTNMTIETLVGIARVLDCHFSEFIPRPPQQDVAARRTSSREPAPHRTCRTRAPRRPVAERTKEKIAP